MPLPLEYAAAVEPLSPEHSPDRKLRILHILLATDPGGLSKYVIDLANATASAGHDTLVAADRGEHDERFHGQKFQLLSIPLKSEWLRFGKSLRLLRNALSETSIDVIHTHYRRATLLARRWQRAQRAGGQAPPILYTVHLSHISLRFPRNLLTDFGDFTHIASQDAREWCVKSGGVSPDRITLIPHGIDIARFAPRTLEQKAAARRALGLADRDLVAAFVGRLEDPKNEAWLLDLAAATGAQFPNLRVLLAGDGPNAPSLRDRIDRENLHDRVRLLGERDPLDVYRAADALLLPSGREGFSFVCGEAMSVGVPVLRTRTSGTREMIIEGVTGRSTPIDHDAFIAAAIEFLSDTAKLVEMGAAASAHVRANLTYDLQVARTLELYRRLSTLRRLA